jgi:hypothetical protein
MDYIDGSSFPNTNKYKQNDDSNPPSINYINYNNATINMNMGPNIDGAAT